MQVIFDDAKIAARPHPLSQEEEVILHALILALALGRGKPHEDDGYGVADDDQAMGDSAFLNALDSMGANATLGLLVANSDVALTLFIEICQAGECCSRLRSAAMGSTAYPRHAIAYLPNRAPQRTARLMV